MRTTHKDYGCTAIITDKADGTAHLTITVYNGKKVHNKDHANRKAAYAAWRRYCN